MQIRNLSLDKDLDHIYSLYLPFILNSATSFETEIPDKVEFSERLKSISARFPFLIAEENGQFLGYAYANTHRERAAYRWCVETSIYMTDAARGKGFGKLLYMALINELTKRRFTLAYGIITVPNNASIKLHASCGFREFAVHHKAGYKLGSWHDVVWMERDLAACTVPPQEPIFK